jgi:hypothetical protein
VKVSRLALLGSINFVNGSRRIGVYSMDQRLRKCAA